MSKSEKALCGNWHLKTGMLTAGSSYEKFVEEVVLNPNRTFDIKIAKYSYSYASWEGVAQIKGLWSYVGDSLHLYEKSTCDATYFAHLGNNTDLFHKLDNVFSEHSSVFGYNPADTTNVLAKLLTTEEVQGMYFADLWDEAASQSKEYTRFANQKNSEEYFKKTYEYFFSKRLEMLHNPQKCSLFIKLDKNKLNISNIAYFNLLDQTFVIPQAEAKGKREK